MHGLHEFNFDFQRGINLKLNKIRLGEFFCGPGGIALGAELANEQLGADIFQHAWAVDNHEDTCETYENNIANTTSKSVICDDVRNVDVHSLGKIDGFAYGFPCNDFSLVGEHKGIDGKFGPLYRTGIPVLDIHRPLFFIAENVGGIVSANGGNTLRAIITDLENAGDGYNVAVHRYKFEQYGVPQSRHRVIMVGIRKDIGCEFRPPKPTSATPVTAKQAITIPPIPSDALNNELTRQSANVVERLKLIKPGQNAWTAQLPDHLKIETQARLSQIYKRLDPDQPSYTITGSGGGGTHVYHWEEPRALTNRERARLQTFPDDYEFYGSKESVRRQIGMAVPPVGVAHIFLAIYKTLAGQSYPSVEPNIEM